MDRFLCALTISSLYLACKVSNYVGGKSVGVIGNYNVLIEDIQEYNES